MSHLKSLKSLVIAMSLATAASSWASVDSDFKERPIERFAVATGDGNYKQAYRWSFNSDGKGQPVTIFLNHGSGGEWYDEIATEFGACGPDYLSTQDDFEGGEYEHLCDLDDQGNILYRANFEDNHVPAGPELEDFMLRKIVGSTQFAAWYWADAFAQYDSPVNIFMVGRYNIVKDPSHLDNVLYWVNTTNLNDATMEMQPPYNFDGYGLADIDRANRPIHAGPELSGFDNMFLYKAVAEQYPNVSLENVILEGRSNGGSAMIALASEHGIWTQNMRDFWARNLPVDAPQEPEYQVTPGMTLEEVMQNPVIAEAFAAMLAQYSEQDLLDAVESGNLALATNQQILLGSAGEQMLVDSPQTNESGEFVESTFRDQLTNFTHGNFYHSVKMVHSFYPGCSMGGIMQKDDAMVLGEVAQDGDNASGYSVSLPIMMSFGNQDSLYGDSCDQRIVEGSQNSDDEVHFIASDITDGNTSVIGEVFAPARHGFDYKDVYKNLDTFDADEIQRSLESRRAIERVVNQAILQLGLQGSYVLPENLD